MQNTKNRIIKEVINDLLEISNKMTTLEVKMECINRFPEFYWKQQDVKLIVDGLYNEGYLYISDDNGTYRTYSTSENTVVDMPTKSLIKK